MKRLSATILATTAVAFCVTAEPRPANRVADRFTPAEPGTVRIEGWLGQRMASNLAHHVMAQNVGRIIQPFRDRTEQNSGHWRCEYWGKWFTSAALGCAYEPTPEHRAVLDRGLHELLATVGNQSRSQPKHDCPANNLQAGPRHEAPLPPRFRVFDAPQQSEKNRQARQCTGRSGHARSYTACGLDHPRAFGCGRGAGNTGRLR